MSEIFLIRHAQSTANTGDVAFGNIEAPLSDHGLQNQIPEAKLELLEKYGINPNTYNRPVATSFYRRTYQTASALGFTNIDKKEILNESDIYTSGDLNGVNVIQKHVDEGGWLPKQEIDRARKIIEDIQDGLFEYEIIFSHGMVIAGIIGELNRIRGSRIIIPDAKRGYVPLQAQIIKIEN